MGEKTPCVIQCARATPSNRSVHSESGVARIQTVGAWSLWRHQTVGASGRATLHMPHYYRTQKHPPTQSHAQKTQHFGRNNSETGKRNCFYETISPDIFVFFWKSVSRTLTRNIIWRLSIWRKIDKYSLLSGDILVYGWNGRTFLQQNAARMNDQSLSKINGHFTVTLSMLVNIIAM
jgi:hypothetical protein